MIRSAIWRRDAERNPTVTVVVAIAINGVSTDSRVRRECATSFLVGPENGIQTKVKRRVGLIFPEGFAALRLFGSQQLGRSQTPDRSIVHRHDATALWIESNVELAAP